MISCCRGDQRMSGQAARALPPGLRTTFTRCEQRQSSNRGQQMIFILGFPRLVVWSWGSPPCFVLSGGVGGV